MKSLDKYYLGEDGFKWWFGVVESRQDPLGLGRVQVRVLGTHSQSLQDIPSQNLPWASMSFAVNDRMFGTPREDDMVWGFWTDTINRQIPIVVGVIPGYFTNPANIGQGFGDLRSNQILKTSPKRLISRKYNTNGAGIILTEANIADPNVLQTIRHPTPDELGQDSITGISRYQNLANTVIQARKNNLDTHVLTAGNVQFSEPYPAYNPLYPYDAVTETESGHVFELDDTPGSERIQIAHRSGSFVEWFPTGTKVEKITKSNYSIVMADDCIHVMGRVLIAVGSDARIKVNGSVILEAGGGMSANVAGDMDFSVGGNFNIKAKNMNMDVASDITAVSATQHFTSSGETDIYAGGNLNQQGTIVNIMGAAGATITAATISLAGQVLADSVSTGATPGPGASQGSTTGLPGAIGAGSKNTGIPTPEEIPVPLPGLFSASGDAFTAQAQVYNQFLVNNGSGGSTTPDANAASNTANCSFNANAHTFISDPTTWQISQNGLNLIKSFEGYAKIVPGSTNVTAYPDPATGGQPFTIGYGTTSAALGGSQQISLGTLISMQTALSYLQESIANEYLPAISQNITVPLTQNMIDAMVSLCYNIGPNNFIKSSVLALTNQQQWCQAANAFLLWNRANGQVLPGLTSRRNQERGLYLT